MPWLWMSWLRRISWLRRRISCHRARLRLQRLRLQRLPLRRLRRYFYRRLWWLWFRRLLPIVGLLPFLLIRGAPRWDIDKRDEDWLQGGANEMEIEDGVIRVCVVKKTA